MEEKNKVSFWKKFSNGFNSFLEKDATKTVLTSLWCALIGLLVGFIIMLCINPGNAASGMAAILKNFFVFNSQENQLKYFGQTLAKTAPLILIGLSIIVSTKCGLFNLGASGQYTIALIVVCVASLMGNMNWFLVMILAILAGALYGMITGLLKAYFNVNEVISGIMLNWIALYVANDALQRDARLWNFSNSETYQIAPGSNSFIPNIGLDKLFAGNTAVGLGIIIALVVVVLIFLLLRKTKFGYEVKALGLNPDASTYAGINTKKVIILSTALAGGLAGLAASLNYQNGLLTYHVSSTVDPIGYTGISAAYLGGLNPIGTIFSSYFITHIADGGSTITDLGFAPEIVDIITALIIYLSGFVVFVKTFIDKRKKSFSDDQFRRNKKEDK